VSVCAVFVAIAIVSGMEYLVYIPPVASVAGCEARFGGPQRFQGPLPPVRPVNLAERVA